MHSTFLSEIHSGQIKCFLDVNFENAPGGHILSLISPGQVLAYQNVELLHFVLMITNPSVTICPSNIAPNTISKQA